MALERRLVVFGWKIVRARGRIIALLHHLKILLVLRVWVRLRMWVLWWRLRWSMRHVYRGRDGNILIDDRMRAIVNCMWY
jgi:hypothetical protein